MISERTTPMKSTTKKILLSTVILATLVILTSCLLADNEGTSIVLISANGSHSTNEDVYISIDTIDNYDDPTKIPSLNVTWHNKHWNDVTYGNWFVIEYKNGDEWTDVSIADVSFEEVSHFLRSYSESAETYTTKFADISKVGTYRLRTEFYVYDQKSDTESTHGITWAEFEVKTTDKLDSHKIEADDGDEYLYEKLKDSYVEGERVTLKTRVFPDLQTTVYINGREIGTNKAAIELDSEQAYWELDFVMPIGDVLLTFEINNNFLKDINLFGETLFKRHYTHNSSIYDDALNANKFSFDDDARRSPLYKIDSSSELEAFIENCMTYFSSIYDTPTKAWLEEPFEDYDESFFEDKSLFVVYVVASSGSYRYRVADINKDGNTLRVCIDQYNDIGMVTCDAASWFVLLPMQKDEIKDFAEFDAIIQ